jgi:fucose permease
MTEPIRGRSRALLGVSFLSFLALGLVAASLGPALPELAAKTGTGLAVVGGVFTAMFGGSVTAQAACGPLFDRFGARPVLLSGMTLLIVGMFGVSLAPTLASLFALAVLAGLGFGALDVGFNVMIATTYSERSVWALNLLNLFFGLGAVLSPIIASLTLRRADTAIPAIWAGPLLFIVALPLLFWLLPHGHGAAQPHPVGVTPRSVYTSALVWLFAFLLFLYVGAESGMNGWTAVYLTETSSLPLAMAALGTSGFWIALTVGRLIGAGIGDRVPAWRVLLICLLLATVGGALLVAGRDNLALSVAAILLIGVSYGPVFPTMIAIITADFPNAAGKAASLVMLFGGLGGMVIPWLQGVLLVGAGPLAAAGLIAAANLAMLGLYYVARVAERGGAVQRASAGVSSAGE